MRARAIYAGSFDPVHNGHLDLIERASSLFGSLIVAVYDHRRPSKSLLFSTEERIRLIEEALNGRNNIKVMPFSGLLINFAEQMETHVLVRGMRVFSDFEFEFRMALANKRMRPKIESVMLLTREEHMFLSGTTVREIASLGGDVSSMVPPNVAAALHEKYADDIAYYQYTLPPKE